MFVRADDLDAAVGFVVASTSVNIVGPEGSGRSTLLRELDGALLRRGIETTRILGVASLRGVPLGALDLAGEVPRSTTGASLGAITSHLAQRSASGQAAILIDDADHLDEHSWGVIAATHARTGAVVITTSGTARTDGARRVHAIVGQAAELRLRPLTFEAVTDLLHGLLDGAVDTSLVARVYTRSAGNPSLAVALVAAAHAHGRLTRDDGVWTVTGELWHDSLTGAVEHLLAPLDRDGWEAIETLSLTGVVDAQSAAELVGDATLEALEAAGLLLGIEPLGRLSVAVTPPLITDYFEHQPTSLRRGRILRRIRQRLGDDRPDDSSPVGWTAASAPLEPDAAETSVIRLIRDRHAAHLAARRHAWERDPRPATATPYLFALFDQQHDRAQALRVFEQTPRDAPDARSTAMLRILEARWHALEGGDGQRAREILHRAATEDPDHRTLFEVWSTHLAMTGDAVTPAHREWLDDQVGHDPTTRDSIAAVRATALLLQGRVGSAREALAGADGESTKLGRALSLLHGWCLFAGGDVREAHEFAVGLIEQSRADLDLENLRGHTYLAAVCTLVLGRFRAAEEHLGRFLALGEPGLGQEGSHMGALALSALLAARAGRDSAAASLASQTTALGVAAGPWPGMVAALPEIGGAVLAGDLDRAREVLTFETQRLRERGYLLAAASLRVIATGLGAFLGPLGSDEDLRGLDGDLLAPLLALEDAVAADDPHALLHRGSELASVGRVELALMAFEHGRDTARRRGESMVEASLSDAIDRVSAVRDAGDARPAAGRAAAARLLSLRELDVARLAAHGRTNREIAEHLQISVRTVESHLSKVFGKLGVGGRADLERFSWV